MKLVSCSVCFQMQSRITSAMLLSFLHQHAHINNSTANKLPNFKDLCLKYANLFCNFVALPVVTSFSTIIFFFIWHLSPYGFHFTTKKLWAFSQSYFLSSLENQETKSFNQHLSQNFKFSFTVFSLNFPCHFFPLANFSDLNTKSSITWSYSSWIYKMVMIIVI